MAAFSVRAGTDWIQYFEFGSDADGWELSDYYVWLHIKPPGSTLATEPLLEAAWDDGRLVISDERKRALEVNIEWTDIDDLSATSFEFDFLFEERFTHERTRSEIHTLTVVRGITSVEA